MRLSDNLGLTDFHGLIFFIYCFACCSGTDTFTSQDDSLLIRKSLAVDLGMNCSVLGLEPHDNDDLVIGVVLELEVEIRPVNSSIKTLENVVGRPCVC